MEIPGAFAQSTVEREGMRGMAWLAALPQIIDELIQRWDCTPAGPVRHGGVGVIVPVRTGARGPAVLKVSFPHPGNVHEPDAFAAWDGRAAAHQPPPLACAREEAPLPGHPAWSGPTIRR